MNNLKFWLYQLRKNPLSLLGLSLILIFAIPKVNMMFSMELSGVHVQLFRLALS